MGVRPTAGQRGVQTLHLPPLLKGAQSMKFETPYRNSIRFAHLVAITVQNTTLKYPLLVQVSNWPQKFKLRDKNLSLGKGISSKTCMAT